MNRRNAFFRSMMALTAAIGIVSSAQAQSKPTAPDGVTIVIPLAAAAGKSRDEVVKAMQNIVAVIRKQPGLLIDEVLMESKNPAKKTAPCPCDTLARAEELGDGVCQRRVSEGYGQQLGLLHG